MFKDKAVQMFPTVSWTGESSIHVSLALEWKIPLLGAGPEEVFAVMYKNDHAKQLFNFLGSKFGGMEWLIDDNEFSALFYVDVYRQLYGKAPTKTKEMIQNPTTGNIFHVIARVDDIVGGIRFWTRSDYSYDDDENASETTVVGFRFRVTSTTENEDETRERIRERCEEAMVEMDLIQEAMEIKEVSIEANPIKIKELVFE